MKILAAVLLFALCCCGCRQAARSTGDFADVKPDGLAEDALGAMLSAYPPAKTRLALLHPADDAFGAGLTEALRGNGYAVAEYAAPARAISRTDAPPPDGLEFAYILDLPAAGELRLALRIGDESLSRLYVAQEGGTEWRPQGPWSRGSGILAAANPRYLNRGLGIWK